MKYLQVVAAVIVDDHNRVLLALRPEDKHQGGLWEFPGGKVDAGETAYDALCRELHEEVAIDVEHARPLITVRHQYPDRAVELDVWWVDRFSGIAHGREGQQIEWLPVETLSSREFPAANLPIITAAQLPDRYLITPAPEDERVFLSQLNKALAGGVQLVQLRAKNLNKQAYLDLAIKVKACCQQAGVRLMLNAPLEWLEMMDADGVHLTSECLMRLDKRPLASNKWLAASCHSEAELLHAQAIGVDFAVLAPVCETATHPEVEPLGWTQAKALIDKVNLPVYVLGGMTCEDLEKSYTHGAQGIAAIRALWP